MGNRSYKLTNAGHSAHGWQIGRHRLAGNSFFPCGRIFIFIFSEPLGINIELFLKLYLKGCGVWWKWKEVYFISCENWTRRLAHMYTFVNTLLYALVRIDSMSSFEPISVEVLNLKLDYSSKDLMILIFYSSLKW